MSLTNSTKTEKTSRSVSEDRESDLSESWVTCNMDADEERSGFSAKEMERLLREAQRESGQSSLAGSSKAGSSPPGTPCNSLQSTPGNSGEASPKNTTNLQTVPEMLKNSPGNTDWVWDWSSTPEARPRKPNQFQRPKSNPIKLSMRKSAAMKSGYFSWEFLQIFIPSMILTNLVAFGLGIYVGKRLTAAKAV